MGTPGAAPAVFKAIGAEQCYRVPPGVTSVHVVAVGARPLSGGEPDSRSGFAATVTADVPVSPGQILYVEVDIDRERLKTERERNNRYRGGGASDVRTCQVPCELTGRAGNDPRLVVAGGGGAGGRQSDPGGITVAAARAVLREPTPGAGGNSGRNGEDGTQGSSPEAGGGKGGTQTAGGAGGTDRDDNPVGAAGGPGVGGFGLSGEGATRLRGGGGGSGWFGGGAGAGTDTYYYTPTTGGGGGGGSSFGPPGATFAAVTSGQPQVRISAENPVIAGVTDLSPNSPPSVLIRSPIDGGHYQRGSQVRASYTCRDPDGAFDLLTCDGTEAIGAPINTSSVGTHTFTVRTRDRARQPSTETVRYTVDPVTDEPQPFGPSSVTPPAAPPPIPPALVLPPPPVAPGVAPPPPPPPNSGSAQPDARFAQPEAGHARGFPPQHLGADATRVPNLELGPDPATVIALMVAAFTLLRFAVGGGFAVTGLPGVLDGGRTLAGVGTVGAARAASKRRRSSGSVYEGGDVEQLGEGHRCIRWGDRSRTWRWPATSSLDAVSAMLPVGLATRSSMLARVTADGVYARSMLGGASVVWPLTGLILGVLAVSDVGGEALPPATALTIAIAMLGVLDATAGLIAVLTFAVGVAAFGGLDSAPALRTLLGLCSLWFVVPVMAGAARPLRRLPASNRKEAWDRAADLVIASLVGAWAVQQIVSALPTLAGKEDLPIAAHADAAALWVLLALAIRIGAETLAAYLYPRRLATVQPRDLPPPRRLQRLAAAAGRAAVFVFVAYVVVGSTWQLWVGAALFVAPEILSIYGDLLPKLAWLARVRPRGLVEVVVVLLVTTGIGALLLSSDYDPETIVPNGFVILSLPGFFLSMLGLFTLDDERPLGWRQRLAGVPLLALAVAVVLGGVPGCGRDLCAPSADAGAPHIARTDAPTG
jgi:hypothetical protein